ncbi:MAG TPA: hypothetical protein VGL40_08975 [Bacillota bacterium]
MRVTPGQTVLVGQGDVSVSLYLAPGATLESAKPFLTYDQDPVDMQAMDFGPNYLIHLRWSAAGGGGSERIRLTIRKGAPLGGSAILPEDFSFAIERRVEPHFLVFEVGVENVKLPYSGQREGYDLSPGRHTFKFAFTKAMDRRSVEEAVRRSLGAYTPGAITGLSSPEPAFSWQDDRNLVVTVDLEVGPSNVLGPNPYRGYLLSANGSRDQEGLEVWFNDQLYVSVRAPLAIMAVSPRPGGKRRTLMTLAPGRTVAAVDGDGQRALALEDASSPASGGDGPASVIPWLYRRGEPPLNLSDKLGWAYGLGFLPDGRVWSYDGQGNTVVMDAGGTVSTVLKAGRRPVGQGFSQDATTFVYFTRAEGEEEVRQPGIKVGLDLNVLKTADGSSLRIPKVATMDSMADFYGPPLEVVVDGPGRVAGCIDLSGGTPRLLLFDLTSGRVDAFPGPEDPTHGLYGQAALGQLAISPDSRAVIFTFFANGPHVFLADLVSGKTTEVKVANAWHPRFSPNGRRVAFDVTAGDEPGTRETRVKVLDRDTGTIVDLGRGYSAGWSGDGESVFVVQAIEKEAA